MGTLNEEFVNQIIPTILYLDNQKQDELNIYINCRGGEVNSSLTLLDTMRYIKSDVATTGLGSCTGMAGFLLSMGQKGKRYALSNTRLMLHHPEVSTRGQADDLFREACELLRTRDRMDQLITEQSGQPLEKIAHDLRRKLYIPAKEALKYDLIVKMVKSTFL